MLQAVAIDFLNGKLSYEIVIERGQRRTKSRVCGDVPRCGDLFAQKSIRYALRMFRHCNEFIYVCFSITKSISSLHKFEFISFFSLPARINEFVNCKENGNETFFCCYSPISISIQCQLKRITNFLKLINLHSSMTECCCCYCFSRLDSHSIKNITRHLSIFTGCYGNFER